MLFYLSNDDVTKQNAILLMECSEVYKYYYLRKLQELNRYLNDLESAKRVDH